MKIISQLLPYIQIILAIMLIALVLMQQSDADLGGAFGGSSNFNAPTHTRRGAEKAVFNSTIIVAILFVVSSFVALIVK